MASFAGKPADGGLWTGPKVAAWMSELLGRPVSAQRGGSMGALSLRSPRPQHGEADLQEQAWKKSWRNRQPESKRSIRGRRRSLDNG